MAKNCQHGTAGSTKGISLYLENVGLEFLVEHDVEAENLEARRAAHVIGKTRAVVVLEHRVRRDERLGDDVIDVVPHLLHVVALSRHPLHHRHDAPAHTQPEVNITQLGDARKYENKPRKGVSWM